MESVICNVLGEIKVGNHSGGRRDRGSYAVLLSEDNAHGEEVCGNHWNEKVKTRR
jgi:hypothetical protein